ncbi:MAG: cytochrome c biogenesis protein ResB [bacterium]|nr:cytochrome c biogenesis protein ResB [bacterium]MDT8396874.1 cytochrome c biogenesis protein ResB [bacterium]
MRSEIQKNTGPGSEGSPLLRSGRLAWQVLVHPVTFVVITILWCVDLAGGSIAAYFNDPNFWQKMDAYPFRVWMQQAAPKTFPVSLWLYVLVVLSYIMVISLFLCTVNWFLKRRKKLKGYGEVLVHLGFLLIFAGFVLGSSLGSRTRVVLEAGQVVPVEEMGVSLRLDGLEVVQSPGGRAMDTLSDMTLMEGGREVAAGTIRTNHPLVHGSTVIYPPEDYEMGITGGVVGTSSSGVVTLQSGVPAPLSRGRTLWLGGVLQKGQSRGSALGPGILVQLKDAAGRVSGSAYLSDAPGMGSSASLAGERLTLGQLVRSARGVYRVHHDPGVWLVFLGTIILALGTVWALMVYLGIIKDE